METEKELKRGKDFEREKNRRKRERLKDGSRG